MGFRLAEYWFLYASDLPAGRFETVETLARDLWQGSQKDTLFAAGRSRLQFRSDGGPLWLGLWVRGDPAFGMGPIIIVRLDKTIIAKAIVSGKEWMRFVFPVSAAPGQHILSVEFVNDYSRPDLGQDRNVELGNVEIIRQKVPF